MPKSNSDRIKFVTEDTLSNSFTELLDKEFKRKSTPESRSIFCPSSMTECDRRLMYRVYDLKSDIPSHCFKYESTQVSIKDRWLHYFDVFRGIKILEENYRVADGYLNMNGIIDAVISFDDSPVAAKIYGLDNTNFEKIKEKGAFKKHVVDMILNLWMSDINDGILIYENKNNQDYVVLHVTPYQPIVESMKKKCLDLLQYKMQGLIPQRCYDNNDSKECKVCEYKTKCWKKEDS